MSLVAPIELTDQDKLETLRQADQFRRWHSLEEKRYCLSCGTLLTGRDLQVVGGTRETGPVRVICPTARCPSIPMDWVLPTDEMLARSASPAMPPVPLSKRAYAEMAKASTKKAAPRFRNLRTLFRFHRTGCR